MCKGFLVLSIAQAVNGKSFMRAEYNVIVNKCYKPPQLYISAEDTQPLKSFNIFRFYCCYKIRFQKVNCFIVITCNSKKARLKHLKRTCLLCTNINYSHYCH